MNRSTGIALALLVLSLPVAYSTGLLKPQKFCIPQAQSYPLHEYEPIEPLQAWACSDPTRPLITFFELQYDEKTKKMHPKKPRPLSPLRWVARLGTQEHSVFLLYEPAINKYYEARLGDNLGSWALQAYEGDSLTLSCGAYQEKITLGADLD